MSSRRLHFAPVLGAAFLLSIPVVSSAQVVLYNNTSNFSGFAYRNGGAANQSGNTITTLVADDIQVAPGYEGLPVNGFNFTVANLNTVAVTARPRVRIYAADGVGFAPGTLLYATTFNPTVFAAGSVSFQAGSGTALFNVPSNGLFWAGVTFDNNTGTTGATAAQLNGLGQGIFNPPTVGSSQDVFFQTTTAGSFAANNPAGGLLFFGGNPVSSFGWRFTSNVPEPGSVALLGGMVTLGGLALRRRRAQK